MIRDDSNGSRDARFNTIRIPPYPGVWRLVCSLAPVVSACVLLSACAPSGDLSLQSNRNSTAASPATLESGLGPAGNESIDTAGVVEGIADEGIPDEQSEYFKDGVVSLEEYRSAFERFDQCGGDEVIAGPTDVTTGLIEYGTTDFLDYGGGSLKNLDVCFWTYFYHTELAFQTSDQSVLEGLARQDAEFFDQKVRPCLASIGVTMPTLVEPEDDEWEPLMQEGLAALADGRC